MDGDLDETLATAPFPTLTAREAAHDLRVSLEEAQHEEHRKDRGTIAAIALGALLLATNVGVVILYVSGGLS